MTQRQQITALIRDKKGNILSIGKNSYIKTHPLQALHARKAGQEHKIFLHAEVDAIIKCRDLCSAHSIQIFRHYRDGSPANAAPCPVCQSAIAAAGIKNISHT